MIYLAIGAIFKNEAHILKEWIEHHLYHGVGKFYLINDNSTDDYMSVLQIYIDCGIVELYFAVEPKYDGRQSALYNKYFLPKIREKKVQWMAIIDLDEFLYSDVLDIRNVLKSFIDYSMVEVNWLNFGSSGHIEQPDNVVQNFTKRAENSENGPKVIINSNFYCRLIGIHQSHSSGRTINLSKNSQNGLYINHYICQSLNFWKTVKMTRGDCDCHHTDSARNLDYFKSIDINEIEDNRLARQNKDIVYKVLKTDYSYRLELPKNTYHNFCYNLKGGSKYGTDGILIDLMKQIKFKNKLFMQNFSNHNQILPFLYENWNGAMYQYKIDSDGITDRVDNEKIYSVVSFDSSIKVVYLVLIIIIMIQK